MWNVGYCTDGAFYAFLGKSKVLIGIVPIGIKSIKTQSPKSVSTLGIANCDETK